MPGVRSYDTRHQSRFYALPLETMPGLDFSHHVEDLVELQEFLEARGIQTRNTRIERYTDYLRHAIEEDPVDEEIVYKNFADGPFENPTDKLILV